MLEAKSMKTYDTCTKLNPREKSSTEENKDAHYTEENKDRDI